MVLSVSFGRVAQDTLLIDLKSKEPRVPSLTLKIRDRESSVWTFNVGVQSFLTVYRFTCIVFIVSSCEI